MPRTPEEDAAADYAEKRKRAMGYLYYRKPKKISDVVAQLIQKHGYGRHQADASLQTAWSTAAGAAAARFSHASRIRRGKLEVLVANSTVLQELKFQEERIVRQLRSEMPEAGIRGLKFRTGPLPR